MNYLNSQTILTGRIGKEPVGQAGEGDSPSRINLSVATNDSSYKDESGEWQDNVTWHPVIAWGPVADALIKKDDAGDLGKGAQVQLIGQYRNNHYTDKDNVERYEMQFYVGSFRILQKAPQ